jgi:amino acid transporter
MAVETQARPPKRVVRRAIVGRAMRTGDMEETLLPKWLALPIFASDPLSSVAYATESALVVLLAADATSAHLVFPISIAISVLLAVVVLSYRQTVRVYESSGGAYIVAKENLGTMPSLVAAAALLTDYVLTVAVSVSAGIFAISSFAPAVGHHALALSLACVVLIALANLRGVREAGLLFALPTYLFVASICALVVVGAIELATGNLHHATTPNALPVGTGAVTLFVLLRAFSSGSTALTGVEAIANGVNAFRRPQGKNAAKTLAVLGGLAIFMFLGVSFLTVHTHARPSATDSVVSQVARAVFQPGSVAGVMYYAVQALTLIVLVLAANTSFQGFPRLAALLARDRFFPRQFTNLGDRLVFSNGIVVLTAMSGLLLWIYNANVQSLIHLYVIGVFTAFTLSQAGMVRYWLRTRPDGWRGKVALNAFGATMTALVDLIVIWTKFAEGAWIVTVAIPLLVVGFLRIRRHYARIARRLRAGAEAVAAAPPASNRTLLVVDELNGATDEALWLARTISPDGFRAVHVPSGDSDPGIRPRWFRLTDGRSQLETIPRDGSRVDALLEQVWREPRGESDFVTVVLAEQFASRSLGELARHRDAFHLKLRLLGEPSVAVADVVTQNGSGFVPERAVCRVLVSAVHAGSVRAVNYAHSLGIRDTRAVSFSFDDAHGYELRREWADRGLRLPLEVDSAPYRDLRDPLLAYLRGLKDENRDAVVVLVMPELIVRGAQRLLHNQRALYLKRILLFEPRVILVSVPYQLVR